MLYPPIILSLLNLLYLIPISQLYIRVYIYTSMCARVCVCVGVSTCIVYNFLVQINQFLDSNIP